MNLPVRAFLSLLVLCFIGAVIYFGPTKTFGIYNEVEKSSLQKIISVKPENIKGKQALMDPWLVSKDEFTFFNTLNDPSMSKFIGLNENIFETQKETNKTSDFYSKVKNNSIFQSNNMSSKKILNPVNHNFEPQKQDGPLVSGFVLQVGSFKTLEKANLLKNSLDRKGYPAFVVAARISEEDEVWHRVVIGGFTEKEVADKAAIRIKKIENLESIIRWQEGPKPEASP